MHVRQGMLPLMEDGAAIVGDEGEMVEDTSEDDEWRT